MNFFRIWIHNVKQHNLISQAVLLCIIIAPYYVLCLQWYASQLVSHASISFMQTTPGNLCASLLINHWDFLFIGFTYLSLPFINNFPSNCSITTSVAGYLSTLHFINSSVNQGSILPSLSSIYTLLYFLPHLTTPSLMHSTNYHSSVTSPLWVIF